MYLTLQDSYIAKNCLIAKFWYIISFTAGPVLLYVSLDSIIDGYTINKPGGSSQSLLPDNKHTEYNSGKCACLFQTAVTKPWWLGLNCPWVSRNVARAVQCRSACPGKDSGSISSVHHCHTRPKGTQKAHCDMHLSDPIKNTVAVLLLKQESWHISILYLKQLPFYCSEKDIISDVFKELNMGKCSFFR